MKTAVLIAVTIAVFAVLFSVRKKTVWLVGLFSSLNSGIVFFFCDDIVACVLVFSASFAIIGIVAAVTETYFYFKRKKRNVNKM